METESNPFPTPSTAPLIPPIRAPNPVKSNNKKLGIIIGIVAVLIIIILLFAGSNKTTSLKTTTISPNSNSHRNSPTMPSSHGNFSPSAKLIPPSGWYSINTQYYSVTVPNGWKPTIQTLQGGVAVLIQPAKAPEDPLLVVESYNVPISIADKVALYQGMGLTKSTQNISNNQAVMVSGTWPTRTINGKTIKIPTQERIVYIPHGNSEFTIRMYYSSPHPEPVYDAVLAKSIASFSSTK